jgi:hypothetical protein
MEEVTFMEKRLELLYEMNQFEWKLVKIMNGKTKALIVREKDGLKNWNRDTPDLDWERRLQLKES